MYTAHQVDNSEMAALGFAAFVIGPDGETIVCFCFDETDAAAIAACMTFREDVRKATAQKEVK